MATIEAFFDTYWFGSQIPEWKQNLYEKKMCFLENFRLVWQNEYNLF